jgi:hypothetical protein
LQRNEIFDAVQKCTQSLRAANHALNQLTFFARGAATFALASLAAK